MSGAMLSWVGQRAGKRPPAGETAVLKSRNGLGSSVRWPGQCCACRLIFAWNGGAVLPSIAEKPILIGLQRWAIEQEKRKTIAHHPKLDFTYEVTGLSDWNP